VSEHVLDPAEVAREPLAGEVALDPATGRPAGRAQALVLLLSSCLAVLGAVLLAPVLPRIRDAFAGTPGVETLTPVVLTAPALVIGLTAMVAGRIVDRVGRKRLLVGALVVYAFVGTAPLWLPSLQLIVASRVLLGLTEAAIMTCCTTLLADYFHGSQRERYLGLQVVCTTVAATLFFGLGGALGAQDWRTPFWLYAVGLPLALLAAPELLRPPLATQFRPDLGDPPGAVLLEGDRLHPPCRGSGLAAGELREGLVEPLGLLVVARPGQEEGSHGRHPRRRHRQAGTAVNPGRPLLPAPPRARPRRRTRRGPRAPRRRRAAPA
jgi:MFS family permease